MIMTKIKVVPKFIELNVSYNKILGVEITKIK
jgi:hypothetical protein